MMASRPHSAPRPALVIAGPTASGKSGLALRLAQEMNGVVINADSMQVYGGIPILSAQPSAADRETVPHRLYGVLEPSEICSAARWRDLAAAEMEAAWAAGRLPVIVGGTGLYIRSLMQGLSPIPDIPDAVRDAVRARMAERGSQVLHAALDPAMAARLSPGDSQRIARAWEVLEATGRSLADWQAEPPVGGVAANWFTITLAPERKHLYAACDARFRAMLSAGALDEARAMAARALPADLPAMKALGLPELMAHLRGEMGLDAAMAAATRSTRNYAKRQGTWFRHQLRSDLIFSEQFSESLIAIIFMKIRQHPLTEE